MKKLRFISLILACVALIGALAACSQDKVPDGYQLVVCEGDEFRLYVPTQWLPNTQSGMTGAIYSTDENSSVYVYVAQDAADMSVEEYWAVCAEKYKNELSGYTGAEKCQKTTLGGQPAYKYVFEAKSVFSEKNDSEALVPVTYKYMQVMAKYKGKMYVLIYSAPEKHYDTHVIEVEGDSKGVGIIPYFEFAEPYHSKDNDKEFSDKVQAPEGMKLISTDARPYRFYVPSSWIVNNRTENTAAYASESDSSNVSVQMYMTSDENQTVEQYWTSLEESYQKLFASYELISATDIKMSGLDARRYDIKVTTGGAEYRMTQAIVKKGVVFYCVTYTATPEIYDKHLADVQKMIDNFYIRRLGD